MNTRRLLPVVAVGLALLFPAAGRAGVAYSSTRMTAESERYYELFGQAAGCSATCMAALEAKVARTPDDLDSRTILVTALETMRFANPEARVARNRHVLWIIAHRPESVVAGHLSLFGVIDGSDAYAEARALWLRQVESHAGSVAVLGNAADFFMFEDRATGIKLLELARTLEPKSPEWPERIGRAHLNVARFARDEKQGYAEGSLALKNLEQALPLVPSLEDRLLLYGDLADAAYLVGRDDKAVEYATALVSKSAADNWNYGNAVHNGQTVLGLIALRAGDRKKAASCLALSGDVKGSPQLDSFGPRMELAKALLQAGERDAVLDYLEAVGRFWKMGQEHIADWTALIKAGRTPDFRK